jgi:hypothetical protein
MLVNAVKGKAVMWQFTISSELPHFYSKTLDYLKKALIYGRTSRISS